MDALVRGRCARRSPHKSKLLYLVGSTINEARVRRSVEHDGRRLN